MRIEVEKYYITSGGDKAYVGYRRDCSCYVFVGHLDDGKSMTWMENGGEELYAPTANDLVAEWGQEVDVSKMWIGVYHDGAGYYTEKFSECDFEINDKRVLAKVTVKDWQNIRQGKRKLIIGEGL